MTGMNSGIRSIGLSTQSTAMITATLADVGTAGSLRSRHIACTQSGRKPTTSRKKPGGSRLANRYRRPHATTNTIAVTTTAVTTFA